MGFEIKQNIYEHGSSRIWMEDEHGRRILIADTFHGGPEFANAVKQLAIEMGTNHFSEDYNKGDNDVRETKNR